jgi:ubiquinone/menaquinone biosynthesis C-methylase UbiE
MWLERPRHYYAKLGERFRGARILDVGCGADKFPGAIGLDVRAHSPANIRADLDRLPWPLREDSFDLIVMRHVLEHMRDVVATVEELYRLAKPGGRIVVEVPHFSWVEAYRHPGHLHFFAGGSFDFYYPGNPHYRAHLRICRRHIYFNDLFKAIGFESAANRCSRFYERHLAFIFPAGSIVWELEPVKGPKG